MENAEVPHSEDWLIKKGGLLGIVLTIILAVLTATIQFNQGEQQLRLNSTQIVGTINGETLTRRDFETEIALEEVKIDLSHQKSETVNKAELLNRIIRDMLILQAATKADIEVDQQEVDREARVIIQRQDMTREEFENLLSDHAVRWESFEQSVRSYLTIFHYYNDELLVDVPFGERESHLQKWISGQYDQAEMEFEQSFLDEVNEQEGECENCTQSSPTY